MTARLDPDAPSAFGTAVLQAAGIPEPDARLVAESLVTAGLWRHPSHGMPRLSWCIAGCGRGRCTR
jgi:LDH2 family malate/lactate/ureidoglycolate dehydrogenase